MGKRWRNSSNERIRKSGNRINHDAACCCCCIASGSDIDITLASITDEAANNYCISTGCDSINNTYLLTLTKQAGPYCCLTGSKSLAATVSSNCGTNNETLQIQIVRGLDPADSRIIVMMAMQSVVDFNWGVMVWRLDGTTADDAFQALCDGAPVTLTFDGYLLSVTYDWAFGVVCGATSYSPGSTGMCVAGDCTIQLA